MANGNESINENFVGWNAAVRAPDEGVVVEVQSQIPDNRQFDPAVLNKNINLVFGNYIIIKHANNTFSLLGHLKKDSIHVAVGETVKRGQKIAAVGASGSANFPHLHYQLQSGPTIDSEGIPSYFKNLSKSSGWIDSGEYVVAK